MHQIGAMLGVAQYGVVNAGIRKNLRLDAQTASLTRTPALEK